ncbi:MAG: 2-C-methyl-D-erythritol 4-phosphate cytidylyltransferase [Nitrospirae bacterium]|nr:2-C-methyl-D-erythritol 4-phosphate cytidylyltransferase [Nitrospirota bacterium]
MAKNITRKASLVSGRIIAIVPAAGIGRRLGASQKKTFVDCLGVPLLIHTLKRLNSVKSITEIIPVIGKEDIGKTHKLIQTYHINKVKRIAMGGKERQDSVYNALCLIANDNINTLPFIPSRPEAGLREGSLRQGRGDKDLILIHDGARPFVTAELIKKLLSEIQGNKSIDGVIPGIPVKDTIKEAGDDGIILSTKKREKLRAIQTPQVFRYGALRKAYDRAQKTGFYATDDAALVEKTGGKIKIILGHPYNIKVTTPEDMGMVEYLLSKSPIKI